MAKESATSRGPRPMWSGTVAFGLVTLPVRLYPAVRSSRTSLKMTTEDGETLTRRYFSSVSDEPLRGDDIVRGYPVGDDRYVEVEDEELEGLAPEKSQEIDLSRFVPEGDVDPMFYERGYFLAPDRGALKAYRLLAKSMEDAGRMGIATFVMRDTEYLVAIIAEDGVLRAQTLRFPSELRTPDDVGLPELDEPDEKRVDEVAAAIRALEADDLDRSLLEDRESRRLRDLVAAKVKSGEGVVEASSDGPSEGRTSSSEDVDLMQVLKQSLAQDDDSEAPAPSTNGKRRGKRAEPSSAERLEDATKTELYERAQDLEIEGRSAMTKKELAAAIRSAT